MRVEWCTATAALALLAAVPAVGQLAGTTIGNAQQASKGKRGISPGGMDMGADTVGSFPKFSLATIANLEGSGLYASSGPARPFQPYLRFDTVATVDVNEQLTVYGLFQFKARAPRPADDPNRDLFVNQGAGRREGGKMKELYVRYGTWRVGKFVQDFGRAYVLLPGPFAADFIEEPDAGYEPSEMIGVEKLHVFKSEHFGWQQLSVSAFMKDRTPFHRSFPYDEGQVHYRDGGVGNTHLPNNFMITYDALNVPIGHGAQATFQASAIRFGRTYNVPRGEFWTTVGGDITIPLDNTVRATLERHYTQFHFYVEAARRANYEGQIGRSRSYLTGAADLMRGQWQVDVSATGRWTDDPVLPVQRDTIVTGAIGHTFPTQSLVLLSVANERVADRSGVYAGIRLVQTLTTCSRCSRGAAY